MTKIAIALRQLTRAAVTALVCVSYAQATSPNAQTRYRSDMIVCNSGQSQQSAVDCRREAGSALAEARRGSIQNKPEQYQSNALQRCAVHQGDDRVACEARITGQGDITSGVEAGGLLRKSITVTPVQ